MTNAQPLRQMAFKETGYHIKFLFLGITDMETAQYQFQRGLRKILLHRTDDIRNAPMRAGTQHGHFSALFQCQRQFVRKGIRHNRARGTHSIELMVDIVAELTKAGMSDEWIKKNIGMDADELLRLKQISGLMELFADREFTIPEP